MGGIAIPIHSYFSAEPRARVLVKAEILSFLRLAMRVCVCCWLEQLATGALDGVSQPGFTMLSLAVCV